MTTRYAKTLARLVEKGLSGEKKNIPSVEGLRRTKLLLSKVLGQSQVEKLGAKVIHVVGTNGKGSVSWKSAQALQACFPSVGLFTSPHLFSVRERFRINGRMIDDEEFIRTSTALLDAAHNSDVSYFELLTCIGLIHMSQCDAIVLETGMGGGGDATNVLSSSRVVVLTTVGLDHVPLLGTSLSEICQEKIATVKPSSRVVIGPGVHQHLESIILESCHANQAFSCKRLTTLPSKIDDENALVSKEAVLEFLAEQKVPVGTTSCFSPPLAERPPGRMQTVSVLGTRVILDVGHNAHALDRLMSSLPWDPMEDGNALVFGMVADKDHRAVIQVLLTRGKWKRIECVQAKAKVRRMADSSKLEAIVKSVDTNQVVGSQHDISKAISSLSQDPSITNVLVCGSHALMAEAFRACNIPFDADPFDSNEGCGLT